MEAPVSGSPIESALIQGIRDFMSEPSADVTLFDYTESGPLCGPLCDINLGSRPIQFRPSDQLEGYEIYGRGTRRVSMFADVRCKSYRLDIVLDTGYAAMAVECDGHEWHDRTKQMAAYDRSRDRQLLTLGLPTIRFTGSEIYHSVDRCVIDLVKVLARLDKSGLDLTRALEAVNQRPRRVRKSRATGAAA
jgi:very-short-patch-repair endonuclease